MATNTIGAGVVLNEGQIDVDFKVEGNSVDHLLMVDGSSDRVGIGVSGPDTTLHIAHPTTTADYYENKGLLISESGSADGIVAWSRTDSECYIGMNKDLSSGTGYLGLGMNLDSDANKMVAMWIRESGKVGIGTASPGYKLDIKTGATTSSAVHIGETEYSEGGMFLTSVEAGNATWSAGADYVSGNWTARREGSGACISSSITYHDGTIRFNTDTGLTKDATFTPSERIRIDSAGYVGIGTDSPDSLVHIYKASAGSVTADSNLDLVIEDDSDTGIQILTPNANHGRIYFGDASSNSQGRIVYGGSNVSTAADRNAMMFHAGSGSERMRVASDGKVTIGHMGELGSSLNKLLTVDGDTTAVVANFISETSDATVIFITNTESTDQVWGIGNAGSGHATGNESFYIRDETASANRVIIDNGGQIGIGGTPSAAYLHIHGDMDNTSSYGLKVDAAGSDGSNIAYHAIWVDEDGDGCGSITSNNSGNTSSYNESSDYRLKENEVAISDGITRLNQLNPYRFNWKKSPDYIVDGFFAHEVQEIVPQAVVGEKDAVDKDGEIERQMIDHSKLVPLLVAAVKELSDKVKVLENA